MEKKKKRKKNANKFRWLTVRNLKLVCIGVLIVFAIWVLWLLATPFIPHDNPEQELAVRKDATGRMVQRITCITSSTHDLFPFPGPHGWARLSYHAGDKYYCDEPGARKFEMRFLRDQGFYGAEWKPIENSSLWLITTDARTVAGARDGIRAIVLDKSHILHERILSSFKRTGYGFEFKNGNQTIIYQSREGMKTYDVRTDTETDWKK